MNRLILPDFMEEIQPRLEKEGYTLKDQISNPTPQGSNSFAWLVEREGVESILKIATYDPRSIRNPDNLDKLEAFVERERRILGQLGDHPSIPRLIKSFDADYGPGNVHTAYCTEIELIQAPSLAEIIKGKDQISEEEAKRIARDAGSALGLVHSKGAMHRDVKPENVFLNGKRAYIADFGIATLDMEDRGTFHIYAPYYPLDFFRGQKPNQDLVALGNVIISSALGKTIDQVRNDQDKENFNRDNNSRDEDSDRLDVNRIPYSEGMRLFLNKLTQDPRQRYQSAEEALSGLEELTGETPSTQLQTRESEEVSTSLAKGKFAQRILSGEEPSRVIQDIKNIGDRKERKSALEELDPFTGYAKSISLEGYFSGGLMLLGDTTPVMRELIIGSYFAIFPISYPIHKLAEIISEKNLRAFHQSLEPKILLDDEGVLDRREEPNQLEETVAGGDVVLSGSKKLDIRTDSVFLGSLGGIASVIGLGYIFDPANVPWGISEFFTTIIGPWTAGGLATYLGLKKHLTHRALNKKRKEDGQPTERGLVGKFIDFERSEILKGIEIIHNGMNKWNERRKWEGEVEVNPNGLNSYDFHGIFTHGQGFQLGLRTAYFREDAQIKYQSNLRRTVIKKIEVKTKTQEEAEHIARDLFPDLQTKSTLDRSIKNLKNTAETLNEITDARRELDKFFSQIFQERNPDEKKEALSDLKESEKDLGFLPKDSS